MSRTNRFGQLAKPLLLVLVSLAVAGAAILVLRPRRPAETKSAELVLYCAAGLIQPVQDICVEYEKAYGTKVRIEPDASGSLLSKIRVAPDHGDLFLAGEDSYLRQAQGLGLVAEVLPVANQHLAIAVKPDNPRQVASVKDLTRDNIKVALPNPELTAVGKSAQAALGNTDTWKNLQEALKSQGNRVSLVGKVNEAAQAVKVGSADAALVWDATARQFGLGLIEVPELTKQVETAAIGVLARCKQPTAALHFARYLTAKNRGQLIFARHFLEPLDDADVWAERPALTLMSGAMLKPAIDDLVKAFQQREGVDINTIYAGCGIHVAQMKAMKKGDLTGSHFPDAYFACDVSFMKSVQQWFEASKVISRNDMVLVVPKGNPKKVKGIDDLARGDLRIGLGHPSNSALGALTDDMLKKLGLHQKIYAAQRPAPIVHTDAGHTLVNQMRTGALDAMIVYRSNVASVPELLERYVEIVPMNLAEAVAIQPYAVARDSQCKYLMGRLLDAVLAPESERHFKAVGFQWLAGGEKQ